AHHLARQDQSQGAAAADQSRQPLRAAAARQDAQLDLRLPELRRASSDADVACECQLAAAAERVAVDHRDRRLRAGGDLIEYAAALHDRPLLDRRARGELANVCTGDERPVACAREHDDTYIVACATCIERFRSEEHTSELQSREKLVCRLLLEKKK